MLATVLVTEESTRRYPRRAIQSVARVSNVWWSRRVQNAGVDFGWEYFVPFVLITGYLSVIAVFGLVEEMISDGASKGRKRNMS
jgi:hypothetical protein